MALTGSGSLSKKRLATANQSQPAVGFQKVRFAHKASAGATSINLNSLTVPPEMSANGFTNPSAATLTGAQLLFYRNNLTLWSSINKELVDEYHYTIASSGQINFINNYVAQEGEIFVGKIDYNATNGVQVVSAISPPSTGSLAAGQTDFNTGFPFLVNLNSSTQVGAVIVIKNGQVMMRNQGNVSAATVLASNGTITGDYQEVDSGNGTGQIIRFNAADPDNASSVIVVQNGRLAEMPTGSMTALIEALNGQINNMATYVAGVAGVSQSTVLGSTPTNSNLQVFGNIVQNLQQFAALINQSNTWTAFQALPGRTDGATVPAGYVGEEIKATFTTLFDQPSPVANTIYDVTGLSITLTPGVWDIHSLTVSEYDQSSATGLATMTTRIRDGANNTLQSTVFSYGVAAAVNPQQSIAMTTRVTVATSTTYKISIAYANSSGTPTITDLRLRGDLMGGGAYILGRRVA